MKVIGQWLSLPVWSWTVLASVLLWLAAAVLTQHLSVGLLLTDATLASFLALMGLGQMVVITSGDGSIDISMPYVLTLAAYLSATVMSGSDARIVPAILLALAASVVIGLLNGVLVLAFRIPPIVTTLAMGYLIETLLVLYDSRAQGLPSPGFEHVVRFQVDNVSFLMVFAVIIALGLALGLTRTVYGKYLHGMGQNRTAAYLAGIPLNRMILTNFMFSALMGGLTGILLGAFDGGAFLTMGTPFLLTSIGAAVLGGTLISGGRSNVGGTLAGALLLTLVVTVLEITKLPIGIQDIVEGLLVIVILLVSGASNTTA